MVTGNGTTVKHVAVNVLYSLRHLGSTIPPQADAGWSGEASPGPSKESTQRNTTFLTWNLMHLAAMLKGSGGSLAHGKQRSWDAGARFDHPNPEYR